MNAIRWLGVVLIVVGAVAMGQGSFSFTKATHEAKIGPVALSVKEKQTLNVPLWAGGTALAIGIALVVIGGGGKR